VQSLARASLLLAVLVLIAADGRTPAPAQQAGTVTVYSSLPLRGVQSDHARAVVRGIRLALEEAEGRAGLFKVGYESLDDSTRQARTWDAYRESRNARRVALDESAVAYIGALNSYATGVSLPILNEAGVFQVSPTNTFVGLTRDEPGAGLYAPEKYYPTGERTYVRVIPRDTIEAAALALLMQRRGCERAYLLHDGTRYGRGLAKSARQFARRRDMAVVGFTEIDARAPNYRGLGLALRERRSNCMLFGGSAVNNAVQLFRDVSRDVPRARLFGGDGLTQAAFTDPRRGGLPHAVARKTRLTRPALVRGAYPPAGQDFFTRYRARFGKGAGRYGIYGYEAMSLVLDAITRAGAQGNQRAAVVAAGFATRDRQSVLGTYSIDRFGDTTLTDYGVYRIASGRLLWDRVVRP
jgi:branched-chain amino acid transport system substrate-binding protein